MTSETSDRYGQILDLEKHSKNEGFNTVILVPACSPILAFCLLPLVSTCTDCDIKSLHIKRLSHLGFVPIVTSIQVRDAGSVMARLNVPELPIE